MDDVLTDPMQAELDRVVELLAGKRIAVLSGAGLSTDSGIPDYRGDGRVVRKPMTFQEFRSDAAKRQRYWAGSHLGWRSFAAARPNAGHRALAALERAGLVTGVVTQNVDGLHLRSGSRRVVEIHGSMDRAVCLTCGQVFSRADLAAVLDRENPWIDEPGTSSCSRTVTSRSPTSSASACPTARCAAGC